VDLRYLAAAKMQTSRPYFAVLGALLIPALASSQAVGGVGDDARVLPGGAVSFRTGTEWTRYFERYAKNPPGRKDGALEPLGQDFNLDTLGSARLEYLSPVEAGVRLLAGMPDFNASLGKMVVRVRDHVLTTPVALEFGVMSRLTVGAVIPFVTATSEVDFRMNPTGREPTVGFNPTLGAPTALASNASLLAQFDSAAAQLSRQLASCPANPSQPGCAAVNANPASARNLLQNANAFANGLAQVYGGRNGAKGALFVPLFGTAAQSAIEARISGYKALFATFGAGAITAVGPVAAQAPLTVDDAQRVFTDPLFGIGAQPLATTITRGMGDIEVSAKLKLVDTFAGDARTSFAPTGFNWRQSIGGSYRLATGVLNAPDNFTDIGTGQHDRATEVRSFTDLLFGPHFWLSVVARYNMPMADERVIRITDSPDQPLAAAYRQQTVKRKLGNEFNIAVNPRWTLNDYVGLSGHYDYRSKSADAYTGTFNVSNLAGQQVAIDASTLDLATDAREHRLGLGVSFSTVAAFERGTAAFPVEITYSHFQTTRGSLGDVPKLTVDLMQVRVYGRLFGR
jgi:hypothetical protein